MSFSGLGNSSEVFPPVHSDAENHGKKENMDEEKLYLQRNFYQVRNIFFLRKT